MATNNEEPQPRCRCGAPIKQGSVYWGQAVIWMHVDRGRDIWHTVRLDWEALNDAQHE